MGRNPQFTQIMSGYVGRAVRRAALKQAVKDGKDSFKAGYEVGFLAAVKAIDEQMKKQTEARANEGISDTGHGNIGSGSGTLSGIAGANAEKGIQEPSARHIPIEQIPVEVNLGGASPGVEDFHGKGTECGVGERITADFIPGPAPFEPKVP